MSYAAAEPSRKGSFDLQSVGAEQEFDNAILESLTGAKKGGDGTGIEKVIKEEKTVMQSTLLKQQKHT